MGSGASTISAYTVAQKQRNFQRSDIQVVDLMMPAYYNRVPPDDSDIAAATVAWNHILNGNIDSRFRFIM